MKRPGPGDCTRGLIAGFCLMLLAACSKVTLENYDRLKIGMDYDEVVAMIGDPTECSEALGTRACRWGNNRRNIKVTFFGSKATLFSAEGLS